MSARELKRVEAFVANIRGNPRAWLMRTRPTTSATDTRWSSITPADLRAVLALATCSASLKRRIRIAKRALRKSTKYEPWDDFEWTASIALDLRRTDFEKRQPVPARRGRR